MHSLHKAALDAGAYKGRQMLYLDSLRPRPPRANDMENIDKVLARVGVSTSWRAEEERTEFAQKRLSRIGPDQKEPDPATAVGVAVGCLAVSIGIGIGIGRM